MTQGRERISLAQKPIGVSRRLSVAVAMFALAAFLVGTAGTSFAKKNHKNKNVGIFDTIVVANAGGGSFGGSVATFLEDSHPNTVPFLWVKGTVSLLAYAAPAGVAISSDNDHIAVAQPFNFFAAEGLTDGGVSVFGPGSTGDSAPEIIIGSPFPDPPAIPNTTGIDLAQGVGFEDPHDGVFPGTDLLAVANELPVVVGPDFPGGICDVAGISLGTITEFDLNTLVPGFNDVPPFNNSPVDTATGPQNATIGGCDSFLGGPIALRFDEFGFLYVVNEGLVSEGGPGFVTAYPPGAFGDASPIALIGLEGPTAGIFVDPAKIAVLSSTYTPLDDLIFVTDVGDSSVKVIAPFANAGLGELLGTIEGGHTKFHRPTGIAYSDLSDTLYVTNALGNTVAEFTDASFDEAGGNISPTLITDQQKRHQRPD